MKKPSGQGLRRFRVEVSFWGNYAERIAEFERALAKNPRTLQIEIVGTGELSADAALRFRAALMKRSPKTRIVTHAHSTLQGGSVLLWLLGDSRTIRDDARLFFRRTTLSDDDMVPENGVWKDEEPAYRDSYSAIDPDEGDYARVLQIINEFLPVREMAGQVDRFLAAAFSKSPEPAGRSLKKQDKPRVQRSEKARARSVRE
jgi:hypothetical protein